jgi:hypothetical protein
MIKNILTSTVVALATSIVVTVLVLSAPSKPVTNEVKTLGAGIETVLTQFGGGIKVGNRANLPSITQLIAGSCNLISADSAQLATTTASYDCAVTGVRSGDKVIASMSTSTNASANFLTSGWAIRSAHASTTNGYITIDVMNLTGKSTILSSTAVGSSTNYIIFKN